MVTLFTRFTERKKNRPEVFKVVHENIVLKYFDKFQWKLIRPTALLNKRPRFLIFFAKLQIVDYVQVTASIHGNVVGQTWFLEVVVLNISRKSNMWQFFLQCGRL